MKIPCLLLYSFTFQMAPKTLKCVYQEKQDNFSCKHENTLKSMEFFESNKQLCLLTESKTMNLQNGKEVAKTMNLQNDTDKICGWSFGARFHSLHSF